MRYKFSYQTTAFDFWQLSMYSIYSSMIGVCNMIFTISIFLLMARFWKDVNGLVKILMILTSCLFIVIQPAIIYRRARRQEAMLPKNMEIAFDHEGIHIKVENKSSDLKWENIKGISKKPTMIIIFSTMHHGFVLNNKVLGKEKEPFYDFLLSQIQK